MYKRNYRKVLKEHIKSKKYIDIIKNSMRINHFLENSVINTSKGLFCRLLPVEYFMVGLKGGNYAYTRKLYNFVIFKNKRRR